MLLPLDVLRIYPPHDATLNGVFMSRCSVQAQQLLLIDGKLTMSWEVFGQRYQRLARAFASLGVCPGDRVAVVARNGIGHVLTLFALARLGAVMVPVNPDFAIREMKYVLAHSDVSAVLVDAEALPNVRSAIAETSLDPWLALLNGALDGLLNIDDMIAGSLAIDLPEPPNAAATCVIVYTSGTTGFPKGVMHSQGSLMAVGEANLGRIHLQPDDRVMVVLPFFHVNALFYSLAAVIAAGASLVIVPRFSASRFWQIAADTRSTVVNIIEAMGTILMSRDRSEYRQDHCLRVVYGVRNNAAKTFREDFAVLHLFSGFGMTEIPGVTCNPINHPGKPGSMGVLGSHPDPARDWAQCRIVDEQGLDVAVDVVGELLVKTPVVMQGYFRDPEQTAAAFRDGWLMTGDLVRRDNDGYFFYVTRKKDIIRRRGENIAAAELDMVISAHPSVYESAAIAVPSELGEDDILTAIVIKPGHILIVDEMAQWCRERLASHKVPRYIAFLDALPHTPTHKIAKAVLRQDSGLRASAVDLQANKRATSEKV